MIQDGKDVFVYHYVALYREPIFRSLKYSSRLDFLLISDVSSNNDIKVADVEEVIGEKFFRCRNRWFFGRYLYQLGLLRKLRSEKVRTVTFLGDPNFLTTWIALVYLKFMGIPSFLWTHGFINRGGRVRRRVLLLYYRLCSGIFLYGEGARAQLLAEGFDPKKLHVIYNSLNYSRQKSLRLELLESRVCGSDDAEREVFNVVFIGRLTFHKKLDFLIRSIPGIISRGCPVVLTFVGDGEAKEGLMELASNLGVGNSVNFTGAAYDERDIAPILTNADCCVSPGEVGLTAMHALAYGTPVVTHSNELNQMPEFEAVISGVTGELFSENDLQDMTHSILKIWRNGKSFYGDNCISIIEEKYNPEVQARLIEKVLLSEKTI